MIHQQLTVRACFGPDLLALALALAGHFCPSASKSMAYETE